MLSLLLYCGEPTMKIIIDERETALFDHCNTLLTSNPVSSSSVSAKDLDNIRTDFINRQKSVQPIQAQPPV